VGHGHTHAAGIFKVKLNKKGEQACPHEIMNMKKTEIQTWDVENPVSSCKIFCFQTMKLIPETEWHKAERIKEGKEPIVVLGARATNLHVSIKAVAKRLLLESGQSLDPYFSELFNLFFAHWVEPYMDEEFFWEDAFFLVDSLKRVARREPSDLKFSIYKEMETLVFRSKLKISEGIAKRLQTKYFD
jgi:hypothetical protein